MPMIYKIWDCLFALGIITNIYSERQGITIQSEGRSAIIIYHCAG